MTYNHRLRSCPIASLIGDAVSLINPLNGEGINTLWSVPAGAETLAPCLRDDDFSAQGRPFAARVESEMRYDMALARLIVQLISNRALTPVG
jgi:flavin-dependent dehydrogenase